MLDFLANLFGHKIVKNAGRYGWECHELLGTLDGRRRWQVSYNGITGLCLEGFNGPHISSYEPRFEFAFDDFDVATKWANEFIKLGDPFNDFAPITNEEKAAHRLKREKLLNEAKRWNDKLLALNAAAAFVGWQYINALESTNDCGHVIEYEYGSLRGCYIERLGILLLPWGLDWAKGIYFRSFRAATYWANEYIKTNTVFNKHCPLTEKGEKDFLQGYSKSKADWFIKETIRYQSSKITINSDYYASIDFLSLPECVDIDII